MLDIFQYDFMVNAMIACVLASIACGIVGSYILVKRIVFISGGIAHTAYGGIGLGYFLGINPLIGAVIFSVGASSFISVMRKQKRQNEDMLIGIMWAFGMAVGIMFTNLTPGYAPNLMSYLFGNLLMVPSSELIMMFVFDILIVGLVTYYFDYFKAVTFDEEYSRTLGLPVDRIYFLLFLLIAITTVLLIKLVGIILIIALLSIPASISIRYVTSLKAMMILSIIIGFIFTFVGLLLSYYLNLASGATIILVAVAGYLISNVYQLIIKR